MHRLVEGKSIYYAFQGIYISLASMLTSPRYSGSLIAADFLQSVIKIPHAFENHLLGGHKTTCACQSSYE